MIDAGGSGAEGARVIIEYLSTSVILLDGALRVVDLNPAAENLLGVSLERARGTPLVTLCGDNEKLAEVLQRAGDAGQTYAREITFAARNADYEQRITDCRVTPHGGVRRDVTMIVEFSDVTRRSRITRENALLAQHFTGRKIIRQLAHEIKNPLGGLRGAAQLLERQLASPELKEYTGVIIREADRLAGLVDSLLGPGGRVSRRETNIHEVLEHVAQLVTAESEGRLNLERDYDPGLPAMMLDRDLMVQAVLNLVRNAVAATGPEGTVTLRTRAVTNFTIGDVRHRVIASIDIEDDGPGIPEDLKDSVFYPLVTSRPEGTGLGLPLAQELVNRHGGLIEFASRPGATVFHIRLPLADGCPP
ncbi:MAG TPA: nitrogen regulation protein NR(II) [Woeseiaceae bacterium]|nr:nitrogen regulation protein NR(II) [Woeseiaceae bacterium]